MSDTISRRQAIEALRRNQEAYLHDNYFDKIVETDIETLTEMPSAQPEPHYDEWCTDCKEYDHERHCCPRWNRVIRETLKDAQPNTDHIYAELSKVYNVKGLPDEAIGIIGDLMLSLDGSSAQSDIIRCGECRHLHDNDCPAVGWGRNDDDYCAWAERDNDG